VIRLALRSGPRSTPRLPSWLVGVAAPVQRETAATVRRRRKAVTAVSVAGAGLLGASLSTKPDSPQFYALTLGVAGTWLVGGAGSGPLHLGWEQAVGHPKRRPVVAPIALGVGAFGAFYGAAHVARHIPVLDRALTAVLQYADQGSDALVLTTTLANGLGEEVFFRGALFAALGGRRAVPASTAVYMLATTATRNPALVLASGVMGTLFGLQRRATGGIQAPILTHLTWSALMLRYLPPLFRRGSQGATNEGLGCTGEDIAR
jgi:membrane protease YdiL (CAAX protease family)